MKTSKRLVFGFLVTLVLSATAENKALKHNYEPLNAQMAPEMDTPGEDMELGQ